MWIKQSVVERLIKERSEASGAAQAMERQIAAQNATVEWMMLRLGQLEHERAVLVERYMGVTLAVPKITRAPDVASTLTADDLLNSMPSFEDMGEAEAQRQGVDWDEQGRVVYKNRA
jgi:hypothetical protein